MKTIAKHIALFIAFGLVFGFVSSGLCQPNISIDTPTHDFGSINVGSLAIKTITITNTGASNLLISPIHINPAGEFSKGIDTCSGQAIIPTGTCTIETRFLPMTEGQKGSELSIPSNDPDTATVIVTLSGTGTLEPVFSDCLEDYWAEDFIHTIYYGGVTMGCLLVPTLQYCPTNPVTREQMAAFIVRAVEGEPDPNYCLDGSPFGDVPVESNFCKYIKRLSQLNITQGCNVGFYCPANNVTREQMAAFLVRAVEGEPAMDYCGATDPFLDVPAGSNFCRYIKRLSELNITQGCNVGLYCPTNNVLRDQMAAFLARAFILPVLVPGTVGLIQVEAETLVVESGLTVGTISTVNSNTVPLGRVISQSPQAGGAVLHGTSVNLVVSLGPVMVTVPDVVGMTQANAEAGIIAANLTVGTIATANSPTVPAGSVISQDPVGGTSAPQGSAVNFLVSLGPLNIVTVPDVVGTTQTNAESAIIAAGLIVGTVTSQYHETIPAGIVISQDPAGGLSVTQGSSVNMVISLGLPPDPGTVAPPLDLTVATTMSAATSFLYTGINPIQTGVAPGTIDPKRIVVLRGKVLDRNNNPLPGVKITMLNHPEFGQTLSRADGLFDMVVNGGGYLTVKYQKAGYLPAQRQINVPWQNYAWLPDVVLIQLDSQVTVVDLTSSQPIQVARGSAVTDEDGTRQATLLISQGTQAQMFLPDGSLQPLTTLSIRATEYTVGPNGPKAMPAELPPTSGYTYAVELSVDEALTNGRKVNGKDVVFNQPVVFYVENFLNFPTGGVVPVGYYDNDKGAWIPYDNGRIIGIVGITGGLADVDVNGDGSADTGTALSDLGITDQERERLASLYAPSTSLWRVQISHLSSWDCNWPYGPPMDAEYPEQPDPSEPGRGPDDPCQERGSIIECQNQVLGEKLRLAGTPYSLHYRSNRIPGYAAGRTLRIPLSRATVPGSLMAIRLDVVVAGQYFSAVFWPFTNQVYQYTWDGLDGFGRRVSGWHNVSVRIGYVYRQVYYAVADDVARAFGRIGGRSSMTVIPRGDLTMVLYQGWSGKLFSSSLPDQGLGSWSITPHHIYDPVSSVLYRGDGRRLAGQQSLTMVTTIAAGGAGVCGIINDPCGDGGPARDASLWEMDDMVVAPDGTIYIAQYKRIRKVDPSGTISTIAGNGQTCSYQIYGIGANPLCGDGGPAAFATVTPRSLTVGPDGSLYFLEDYKAIRRIRPDGIIEKVAGGEPDDFRPGIDNPWDGDGGAAAEAFLYDSWDLASGPDGSLYVSQWKYHCVRKIGTDGYINTVAGQCGILGFTGDGGSAVEARLYYPYDLSIGPDGSLYIADYGNYRVRRLRPEGTIETVAGSGSGGISGNGGPAVAAKIYRPWIVAADKDGSFYLTDYSGIRRVGTDGIIRQFAGNPGQTCVIPGEDADLASCGIGQPAVAAEFNFYEEGAGLATGPDGLYARATFQRDWDYIPVVLRFSKLLPETTINSTILPSDDGMTLYHFDAAGRHLKTIDTYTGIDLFRFTYDARGLLSSVIDRDGNTTTLERDSSGNLTAVIGPYGHRTSISLNANGFLELVTDPEGARWAMVHESNGLLVSLTDSNGNGHRFDYDTFGFLTRDEDDAGGSSALALTEGTGWRQVTLTTATGKVTTYHAQVLPTGDTLQVNQFADGSEAKVTQKADGTRVTELPDGSSVTTVQRGNPRFGMSAPVVTSARVRTPSGLTTEISANHTADLTDPADIMSFTSLVEEVTLNGRTYRQVFDHAGRTFTITTPEGRVTGSVLNANGRVVELRLPGLTPIGLGYDAQGRLNSVQQGAGRQYQISYNEQGQVQSVNDPLGRIEQFRFNAANRPTALISPSGLETGFTPDLAGNLTGVTPPGRTIHDFRYTPVGLLYQYDPPPLGFDSSITLVYNADRRVERIARSGQVVLVGYDSAGRVNSITLPGGTGSYAYEYSPVTKRLARATAPGGQTLDLTHDGFLLTGESWSGPISGSVILTFNSDFRPTSQSVSGDGAVAFSYDQDGLLTSVGALSIQRDPASGFVTGTTLGNLAKTFGYDTFGNLATHTLTSGTTTLYSVQYTRDPLGRITEKREDTGAGLRTFRYTYDTESRLTAVEVDGSPAEAYTYDPNGNRLSVQGPGSMRSASYDTQDRLLTLGTATYSYTLPGDLLTRTRGAETIAYQYDELGNLLGATLPDGREIGYVVDAHGRRVGKTVGGSLVKGFLYQDLLRPVAELDGTGAVISRFVYGTQDNLPDYMVRDGRAYLFVADQLGSPKLVVDSETGAIAQRLEYDAFGNVIEDTNPGFQPFGFAGGIYDPDTGLVRFGRRDYDADAGRWTAKDPILFSGGAANLYGYALGDPVNLTDPTGLNPEAIAALGGYLGNRAAGWLPGYLARNPWSAGFADGLSHIPLTHTSLTELMRVAANVDDLTDYCSHRYRAGYGMGVSTGLVIAGIGMIRAAVEMGALPVEAIFGHYGWGMASAGDVWQAVSGIRGAARLGGQFGRGIGEAIGEAIVD